MHPQLCPCPDLKDPRDLQELFLCPSWCHPSLSWSLRRFQSWWPPSPSGAERGKGAGPSPGVQGLTRNGMWERIWWEEPGNRESKQEGEARVGNQLWARLDCFTPALHPLYTRSAQCAGASAGLIPPCKPREGAPQPLPGIARSLQGRCQERGARSCCQGWARAGAVPGSCPRAAGNPSLAVPPRRRETRPAPPSSTGASKVRTLSWCLSWNLSRLPFMGL